MRLQGYLDKIKQGKAIDLLAFKRYLRGLNLSVAHEIDALQARQVKPGRYMVEHIPKALQTALDAYADVSTDSRVSAARQNRSHAVSVSGSMLVVRRGTSHPEVVLIAPDGAAVVPFTCSTRALVIENLENFLFIEQTVAFLARHCGFTCDQLRQTDIIFANGRQITNKLHANFLCNYEQVDLLLDFDLGGFEIAASLFKLLAEISGRYILPDDIQSRLEKIQSPIAHHELERIVTIAKTHERLLDAAMIMKQYQRVLEQENYLE